jgi:chemosensory pili system protein ChpA (sensor histidine kinase/response regulator)
MTIPSPTLPPDNRDAFDTGPLSWVIGEIREALTRSKTALFEAVEQDADVQATSLRHAKTYLHQAHGALQIVDIDGVAIITETVEDLLDRLESGQLALSRDTAKAIESAYQALVEYLEELLAGAQHQPVRLFPYYRALLEVRGAERIHPADLFFPNLAIRPQLPAAEASTGPATDYTILRQRFERGLLPFLKSSKGAAEQANATAMRDIVAEVERMQSGNSQSRGFWWVMHGFSEAVAAGQVPNELYVKQLFARINLQIRRLTQGSSSIAERLLRDALFFIARVENPSARGRQIRVAYQLDGLVPADYEKERYGQIDAASLALAKERLSHAKNIWNNISEGDAGVGQAFVQDMKALAEAGAKLNSPPLFKLLSELGGIASRAANSKPGDPIGLEMAGSLLFIENALNHIGHLSDNFAERADGMTARLLSIVSGQQPAQSAQWLDEMSREAQQRQTTTVLAGEMQTSLRHAEKMLDEYFRDPAQRASLTEIDKVLHQIEGALAIMDQDEAVRAIQHSQASIKRFSEADAIPDQEEFQKVARNLGALGFFIETLQLQSDGAKNRFTFDDENGIFHPNLIEKKALSQGDLDHETGAAVEPVAQQIDSGSAVADSSDFQNARTVEEELAFHQQKSAELAVSLTAEPDNSELQEQLKESLEQVRRDATLIDNPDANGRAQAAIDILEHPDFVATRDSIAEIVTATAPVVVPATLPEPVAALAPPETEEAIDAELLEIFLSEAEEVLGCVQDTIPESRNEPYNQDHLTTLRRSFHTLKGSGRMVGLNAFGEAAWSIEQALNLRLSETRAGDADLYALLDKAAAVLSEWVVDLQAHGRSDRSPGALMRSAERLRAGGAFYYEEAIVPVVMPAAAPIVEAAPVLVVNVATEADAQFARESSLETPIEVESAAEAVPEAVDEIFLDMPPVEEVALLEADLGDIQLEENAGELAEVEASSTEEHQVPIAEVIEFPGMHTPEVQRDDSVKHIGDIEISVPLHNIYLAETDELVRYLSQDISEWRHEPERRVNTHAVHAAHSLAGSSATIGFKAMQEIAHALEMVLHHLERKPVALNPHDFDTLEHAVERIRFMLQMFALGEMPDHEPQQVQILEHMRQDLLASAEVEASQHFAAGPDLLTPQLLAEAEDRAAYEEFLRASERAAEADLTFLPGSELEVISAAEPEPAVLAEPEPIAAIETERVAFVELEPTIEPEPPVAVEVPEPESVAVVGLEPVLEPEPEPGTPVELEPVVALESEAIAVHEPAPAVVTEPESFAVPATGSAVAPELEVAAVEESEPVLASEPKPVAALESLPISAQVPKYVANERVAAKPEEIVGEAAIVLKDDLDADLMPVFVEEGRDILPNISHILRSWQQKPEDKPLPASLLRLLHTIKGSARMAGAMNLGQHMHEMESRIERMMQSGQPSTQSIDDLLASHDQGLQMFEELLNPKPKQQEPAVVKEEHHLRQRPSGIDEIAAKPEMVVLATVMPARAGNLAALAVENPATAAPASAAPLVRVRADILDRLVNQAGEVSISRSRLETEVGTLRQSLSELNENVSRLRNQLREIEMQAETQITSRMAHSGEREFDPLEFDRFTRLQELTRMMAESVNDVGSVQQSLSRTIDSANTDLITQARLTRELQQDLMRVRMVQFASISERLYRVTRQASKEIEKRVNLDIRGSSVEMDRSVLERMAGPFEHLLRNSIVHGIEAREARLAAGKSEVGELLVEIRQEGNEVVIKFTDDGQGLNLDRIRKKAESTGLLAIGQEVSDAEVSDLIFHPGFSTASEVTELAGRGVGMDVVRSEAAAFGGRVAIKSETGTGAQFTIHLPLTLAVTQVVLLTTGGKTFAVPSVLVEQVQQLKTNALAAAYNDGAVIWQGSPVPLYYLSTLLGDASASAVAQQYTPLVILNSGNDRVAIHVDEVIGNREVVVKNIGPQLARMIGIAGATVLGSGEIVLILNPVPLAQRAAQESMRAPRITPSDAPHTMGAVVEMAAPVPVAEPPKVEQVQGLRTQHIVMVVDDSLTVRRVTQRLLARESYQVVLAKDGIDALEQLQSITPDVMLVDIEMPRMDGFDLTRNVRGDERTKHIPIIMITSRTATKHRNYAMELGVNEYLGKPYQEEELLRSIASFVKKESSVI